MSEKSEDRPNIVYPEQGSVMPQPQERIHPQVSSSCLYPLTKDFLISQEHLTKPEFNKLPEIRAEDVAFDAQVEHFYTQARQTGLKTYQLPNSGFDIVTQVNQLQRDILEGLELDNVRPTQTVEQWTSQKVTPDMHGFVLEYVKAKAFLPFKNSIGIYEGKRRLMPDKYGRGAPLATLIKPEERNGAVKRGIEDLEQALINAPPGALAIRTSPPGASGLYTNDGLKEHVYQDSQTQIYVKGSTNEIYGYTIRTDKNQMDLMRNKQFLESLGAVFSPNFSEKSEREQLAEITGKNVFISPKTGVTVYDIISKIRDVAGENAFGNTPFEQIYQEIGHFNELIQIDELTGQYIDRFARFASRHVAEEHNTIMLDGTIPAKLRDHLEVALGLTILELSRAYEHREKITQPSGTYADSNRYALKNAIGFDDFSIKSEIEMSQDLHTLQQRAGCAGGGKTSENSLELTVPTAFGPRTSTLNALEGNAHLDLTTIKEITCPDCKQKHTYRAAEAKQNGKLTCKTQGCNKTAVCWEPFFSKN